MMVVVEESLLLVLDDSYVAGGNKAHVSSHSHVCSLKTEIMLFESRDIFVLC